MNRFTVPNSSAVGLGGHGGKSQSVLSAGLYDCRPGLPKFNAPFFLLILNETYIPHLRFVALHVLRPGPYCSLNIPNGANVTELCSDRVEISIISPCLFNVLNVCASVELRWVRTCMELGYIIFAWSAATLGGQ